ncbi:MAG: BamA/TamA family outer membrane protein, partial [Myxococcales bacterium]|nr:BamA/TamA family outer membrane protein [Myxococcales bacterium]
ALEQVVNVDLRDNPATPTEGAFFGLRFTEGGFFLPSSWNFLSVAPEIRGYAPLPAGVVLAARFGIGMSWILDADSSLSAVDQKLGPRTYRFRGGGASSNRGYLPNRVGGSINGGLREWEASVELRFRPWELFGFVFFADAGDVDDGDAGADDGGRTPRFRFNYLHLSMGGGLRFFTPLGTFRIDLGFQVPGAQVLGGSSPREESAPLGISAWSFPGALNITIGEAF